jgi:DNA-binding transcriptional MerR regulator
MTDEFTLEELEKMSGLPIRTLRFYIQEGLLPGPDTRGKFARYSQKHLDTIRFTA